MVAEVELVVVLFATAPLPAPSSANDPLPETETPTAAARASIVLSADAKTVTSPVAIPANVTSPEEYLWVHKRFKTAPDGEKNPY